MKLLQKKGQVVANLQSFIMAVVTIAVVLAMGLYVLNEVGNNAAGINSATGYGTVASCGLNSSGGTGGTILYTNCGSAYNSTTTLMQKLGTTPTWVGLLIVVVFASAILAYFYMKG